MASGAAAASFFNTYLLANFEALKSDAGAWLRQADPLETVENPTVYRGSTLCYTGAVEEVSRFIGVVAAQGGGAGAVAWRDFGSEAIDQAATRPARRRRQASILGGLAAFW